MEGELLNRPVEPVRYSRVRGMTLEAQCLMKLMPKSFRSREKPLVVSGSDKTAVAPTNK